MAKTKIKIRKLMLILFLTTSVNSNARYSEIVEVLKYVETLNKPCEIGDGGESWGVLQIQKAVKKNVDPYIHIFVFYFIFQ